MFVHYLTSFRALHIDEMTRKGLTQAKLLEIDLHFISRF